MKLNNKGFSLIEILAVVAIMGIMSGLAVAAYTGYQDKVKSDSYQAMESSAHAAAQNYIQQYGIVVPSDGTPRTITVDTLVNSGLLSKLEDPNVKGGNCHAGSYVKVIKEKSEGNKLETYTYIVVIKCRDYTSSRTAGGVTVEGKLFKS